jgi:WD40 repeat protein
MHKIIDFQPFDDLSFGDLVVSDKLEKLTIDCGKLLTSFEGHTSEVISFCANKDLNLIISGDSAGDIKLWNFETGKCLNTIEEAHSDQINSIIIISNDEFATCSDDFTIKLWELASYKCLQTISNECGVFSMLLLNADDEHLACGLVNGCIDVWNLSDLTRINRLDAHEDNVTCLKKTNDSTKLISSSEDNTIKIWDLETFELITTLEGHDGPVNEFEILSNEQKLLSVSNEKSIKLWEIGSSECAYDLEYDEEITSIQLVTDDLIAIGFASDESNIGIYDLKERKIVKYLIGHTDSISMIRLLSDSNQLVTCSNDNTIRLWQL